jgi:hexosaminidase
MKKMNLKAALVGVAGLVIVAGCVLAARAWAGTPSGLNLIPLPQKAERRPGNFVLTSKSRIVTEQVEGRETAALLAERLRKATGFELPLEVNSESRRGKGCIVLTMAKASSALGAEGYELTAVADSVTIRASAPAGLFYGTQTLLELLPPEIFSAQPAPKIQWSVPCVEIQDQPRFPWRGFLLDVARHFFTKAELKNVLDAIALHKLNMLQLHLTDDQGWRLEIKKYPRLVEVGAWRKSIGFNLDPKSSSAYGPDGRYGGFYTHGDIRELVTYAQARHVTLVPEIEMPGHASAALAAYPQLSCPGGPYSTEMSEGVFAGIYCPGKEETFSFLANVLAEAGEIFPGKYVHIGGDEVNKQNWKDCARCQERMKKEGLKTEHELQSYFVRRIEKIVNDQGKRLIGWSEIREGGLAPNATVMDWIGGAVEAASAGHDVVMTPTSHCYLDYYQSRDRSKEPAAIGAFLPLKAVYAFEPVPAQLGLPYRAHILGAQGNLWTEYVASLKHAQYMAFPRVCALAEVVWSPQGSRNWDEFKPRLEYHCRRLDRLGINYRKGFLEE